MCYFFHCYFAMCFGVHLIYYIYARSDCFRHADGFSFSFVLIQKKRKRKEKRICYVSVPTPERPGDVANPFFTPRRFAVGSLFRLCLAFGFYYLVLYTFMVTP